MLDNQEFLQNIQKHSRYTKCITNSFNKNYSFEPLIFRMKNSWFKFEEWDLPRSGIIREWEADDDDWSPKFNFTNKLSKKNSKIIFNANELSKNKFEDRKLIHVLISSDNTSLTFILETKVGYDLIVSQKEELKPLCVINNISIEASIFVSKYGVLFCREDEDGRPNKLYYKSFLQMDEQLIFEDDNTSHRLKIFTKGESETIAFIKSRNFQKGSLFMYIAKDNEGEFIKVINDSNIPQNFDIIRLYGDLYFSFLRVGSGGEKNLHFQSVYNNYKFDIQLEVSKTVTNLYCIGGAVLLESPSLFETSFTILKDFKSEFSEYRQVNLSFKGKVMIYENSFSNDYIFFVEKNLFFEKVFNYSLLDNIVIEESCKHYIEAEDGVFYNEKLIWTEQDGSGVSIPITIVWKSNKREELPDERKCVIQVYGAYGKDDTVSFDPFMLSIIESGFVYTVAHVRGGGFLGSEWYAAGRGTNKWNSINDLINVVKYLSHQNIVDEYQIGLVTSSAGGVIAGAVLNEECNMFKSMLLFSPFINPYNSLVESADSLSKFENLEWGDIENKQVREYIRSYSPVQNISKIRDSSTVIISVLGGKDNYISNTDVVDWVEKLREKELTAYTLLNDSAGHGGWDDDNDNLMFSILNYFLETIG